MKLLQEHQWFLFLDHTSSLTTPNQATFLHNIFFCHNSARFVYVWSRSCHHISKHTGTRRETREINRRGARWRQNTRKKCLLGQTLRAVVKLDHSVPRVYLHLSQVEGQKITIRGTKGSTQLCSKSYLFRRICGRRGREWPPWAPRARVPQYLQLGCTAARREKNLIRRARVSLFISSAPALCVCFVTLAFLTTIHTRRVPRGRF